MKILTDVFTCGLEWTQPNFRFPFFPVYKRDLAKTEDTVSLKHSNYQHEGKLQKFFNHLLDSNFERIKLSILKQFGLLQVFIIAALIAVVASQGYPKPPAYPKPSPPAYPSPAYPKSNEYVNTTSISPSQTNRDLD